MASLLRQCRLMHQANKLVGVIWVSTPPPTKIDGRRAPLLSSRSIHSSRCLQSTEKQLTCLSRIEKTVKCYGYLELSNVDLDLSIRPADPNQYPDSNKAICSFYSTENESQEFMPDFIQEEEKLGLIPKKSYTPKESLCLLEIPMKYGNELFFKNIFKILAEILIR